MTQLSKSAALAVAITCLAACATSRPAEQLSLAISVPKPVVSIGDWMQIDYEISNDGKGAVRGCLTFSEGFDLWGMNAVKQNLNTVDHPSCQKNFSLASGESMRWSAGFQVPDVGVGAAKLTGWIQAAVPGSCGDYGCDQTVVRSKPVTITLE